MELLRSIGYLFLFLLVPLGALLATTRCLSPRS